VSDWRPIDTAPRGGVGKEGPHFLAYQDGLIAVGHFMQWSEREEPSFQMSHVSGWEFDPEVTNPTLWQPLPALPVSTPQDG
jgi:hypothetical protein